MFWIGIGAQVVKPPIPKANVSIVGCNWNLTTTTAAAAVTPVLNSTLSTVTSTTMTIANNTTVEAVTQSALEIAKEK